MKWYAFKITQLIYQKDGIQLNGYRAMYQRYHCGISLPGGGFGFIPVGLSTFQDILLSMKKIPKI